MYCGLNREDNGNVSGRLADYMRKVNREMPLGVSLDLLVLIELRLEDVIRKGEATGTVSRELLEKRIELLQAVRKCRLSTAASIEEVGSDMPIGDMPDYPEDDILEMTMDLVGLRGK